MSLPPLGSVAPTELVRARTILHHAVQLIASAGDHLAQPQPGDGHRSLTWEADRMAFRGVDLEGGFFVRITTVDLVAELVKTDGTAFAALELYDSPLIESLVILESQMPVPEKRRAFVFTQYDEHLPDPAFVERALPLEPLEVRTELALHFAHAYDSLAALAADEQCAAPIRAWPHHFDIATILSGPGKDSTIGVGLSPGDSDIPEPYWYVTPSPLAPDATSAKLPTPWTWHADGWTGMALPVSKLLSAKGKSPDAKLRATLTDCIEIARGVVSAA